MLYFYLIISLIWIVYFINNTHLLKKMKKKYEVKNFLLLDLPFIVFFSVLLIGLIQELNLAYYILNSDELAIRIINILTINISLDIFLFNAFLQIVGFLSSLAGLSIFIYVLYFEKSFPSCLTLKNERKLQGIYKYVRHPSYIVFFLLTFGTALFLLNYTLLIIAIIIHISLYFFYTLEDKENVEKNHHHKEYLKKTKRFFPTFKNK